MQVLDCQTKWKSQRVRITKQHILRWESNPLVCITRLQSIILQARALCLDLIQERHDRGSFILSQYLFFGFSESYLAYKCENIFIFHNRITLFIWKLRNQQKYIQFTERMSKIDRVTIEVQILAESVISCAKFFWEFFKK